MNKKTLIIILFVVSVVVVVMFNSNKTAAGADSGNTYDKWNKKAKDQSGSQTSDNNRNSAKDSDTKTLDQSKVTMNSSELNYVITQIEEVFEHGCYYREAEILYNIFKDMIYTKADVFEIKKNYPKFDIHMSKMKAGEYMEGQSKSVVAELNKIMKENGVNYSF